MCGALFPAKLRAEKEKIVGADDVGGVAVREGVQADIGRLKTLALELVQVGRGGAVGGFGQRGGGFQRFGEVTVERVVFELLAVEILKGRVVGGVVVNGHGVCVRKRGESVRLR